jgi:hypothetical protein
MKWRNDFYSSCSVFTDLVSADLKMDCGETLLPGGAFAEGPSSRLLARSPQLVGSPDSTVKGAGQHKGEFNCMCSVSARVGQSQSGLGVTDRKDPPSVI